jgi:NTE family protein
MGDVKTALVLSAGGMFGAYQAGVWQALSPVFRPDIVIGCSVGSINGWAIAGGISGDELARTWLDPRCAELMRPHARRRPWQTFFDPQPLQRMIQEMASNYTPRVPFALTLTELPRLRLRIFQTPEVTWQHILASCAVPLGYPAVRIGGQSYCDGGLLSVLPVWAAASLDADCAIAVNVLPNKPLTALRAGVRMVRLLAPREPQSAGIEVLRIVPEPPLGRLHDAINWSPETVRRWIARGQADAQALIDSRHDSRHDGPALTAMLGRFV